jgi:hypothetical protein
MRGTRMIFFNRKLACLGLVALVTGGAIFKLSNSHLDASSSPGAHSLESPPEGKLTLSPTAAEKLKSLTLAFNAKASQILSAEEVKRLRHDGLLTEHGLSALDQFVKR